MTMVYDAFETGPAINTPAPDFKLPDHNRAPHTLASLMGNQGLLLGFMADVWQPSSVRRILWMQRHVASFAMLDVSLALVTTDQVHMLYGFHNTTPLPIPFALLADDKGDVHRAYQMMSQTGLLLIDRKQVVRQKWLMTPEMVWTRLNEIHAAIQLL